MLAVASIWVCQGDTIDGAWHEAEGAHSRLLGQSRDIALRCARQRLKGRLFGRHAVSLSHLILLLVFGHATYLWPGALG